MSITSYEAGRQWAATATKAEMTILSIAWQEQTQARNFAWPYATDLAKGRWQELRGNPAHLNVREFIRGALDAQAVTENTDQIPVTPTKDPFD